MSSACKRLFDLLCKDYTGSVEREALELLEQASQQELEAFRCERDTLLHQAAKSGYLQVSKRLATKAPALMRIEGSHGDLPIHRACLWGHFEVAKFLAAAEPQTLLEKNDGGQLPIHWASAQGYLSIVKFLAAAEPQTLKVKGESGCLPIHFACYFGRFKVAKFLAAAEPQTLLEKNDDGRLPIHEASRNGSLPLVKFLAAAKPQTLKVKDKAGKTPLDLAKTAEVASFLTDFAASPAKYQREAEAVKSELQQIRSDFFQLLPRLDANTAVLSKLVQMQSEAASGFAFDAAALNTFYVQLCLVGSAAFVNSTPERERLAAAFQQQEAKWNKQLAIQKQDLDSLLAAAQSLSLSGAFGEIKTEEKLSTEQAQQIVQMEMKSSDELRARALEAGSLFSDAVKNLFATSNDHDAALKSSLSAARAERLCVVAAFALLKQQLIDQIKKHKQTAAQVESRLNALSATASKILAAARRVPQLLQQLPDLQKKLSAATRAFCYAAVDFDHNVLTKEELDEAKKAKSEAYAAFQPLYKELCSYASVLPELAQNAVIQQEQQKIMKKVHGMLESLGGAAVLDKLVSVSFVDEYDEKSRQPILCSNFPVKIRRADNNEWVVMKEFPIGKNDHGHLRSFVNSVSVMSRLEHPHVLAMNRAFHDADYNPGCWYLEMPCLQQNLQEYLEGKKVEVLSGQEPVQFVSPSLAIIKQLFLQICKGVFFLHCNGVVHADLKPANVLLRPGDDKKTPVAVVADFERSIDEFARRALVSASISVGASAIGSLGFIAPELLESKEPTPSKQSDVFSLGKILESMLRALSANNSSDAEEIGALKKLAALMTATAPAARPSLEEVILDRVFSHKEEAKQPDCCVCLDAAADHILIPCGHVRVCKVCVDRLIRSSSARCPLCRANIKSTNKVFY